jgi:methionine-rich copper-binding protein CopC
VFFVLRKLLRLVLLAVVIVLAVSVYGVVSHDKVVSKARAAITAVARLPSEIKADLRRFHL